MVDRTIALPEGGKAAHLAFDVAAMEALHEKYGDEYVSLILVGLDRHNVSTFTATLDAMKRDTEATAAAIIDACTLSELATRIADAISLRLYGKTFKEHQAVNQAEIMAKIGDGWMAKDETIEAVDEDAA